MTMCDCSSKRRNYFTQCTIITSKEIWIFLRNFLKLSKNIFPLALSVQNNASFFAKVVNMWTRIYHIKRWVWVFFGVVIIFCKAIVSLPVPYCFHLNVSFVSLLPPYCCQLIYARISLVLPYTSQFRFSPGSLRPQYSFRLKVPYISLYLPCSCQFKFPFIAFHLPYCCQFRFPFITLHLPYYLLQVQISFYHFASSILFVASSDFLLSLCIFHIVCCQFKFPFIILNLPYCLLSAQISFYQFTSCILLSNQISFYQFASSVLLVFQIFSNFIWKSTLKKLSHSA